MKRKENNHLAEGEVTGHYHEAVGDGIEVFEKEDGSLLLENPEGCKVTHQEHGVIEIPTGTYRTGRVLEYDPAEKEVKEMRD